MNDQGKTKKQLIKELQELRHEMDLLNASKEKCAAGLVITNEKRIADLVERLSLSQESSSSGFWDWDIPNSSFYWSDEFLKLFGMEPGTVPGFESWTKSLHPDDIEAASKKIQDAINEKKDLLQFYRIVLPGGNLKWIRAMGKVTYQDDIPVRMVGLCMDVTDQKLSEIAINESEARFRQTFEFSPVCIVMVGLDKRLIHCNNAFSVFLGYSTEEIIGKSISDITYPEDKHIGMDAMKEIVKGELNISNVQKRYLSKDGDVVWGDLTITLIRDSEKNPQYFIAIIQNITERLQTFETLEKSRLQLQEMLEVSNRSRQSLLSVLEDQRQTQHEINKINEELEQRVIQRTVQLEAANKELEAFSYSVSHDLRAPLRHISGFADMLSNDARDQLSEKSQHYLSTINDSARRMGVLIDDLLSFSRTGRVEMRKTTFNMNLIVDDALKQVRMSAQNRKIEWEIAILPEVFCDYNLLRQVWVNLLENAVKYTRKRDKALIQIDCQTENTEYIFSVRDNGAGFDMKYAQKLFGVFQRLHSSSDFEGTGIGLANVRRIILRHGGRIWAEAELGKGATFYFSLPGEEGNRQ